MRRRYSSCWSQSRSRGSFIFGVVAGATDTPSRLFVLVARLPVGLTPLALYETPSLTISIISDFHNKCISMVFHRQNIWMHNMLSSSPFHALFEPSLHLEKNSKMTVVAFQVVGPSL